MKDVLIITYYWPPSGGSGVQRWLKFVKYLPQFGYVPHVYTVENGEYPVIDYSLEKDIPKEAIIIKKPIIEPYGFYKKLLGHKKNKKLGHGFVGERNKSGFKKLMHSFALWVRGNFFIPDARVLWVKPSVEFLSDYVKSNNIKTIISTGTPHSMHLIAQGVKQRTGVKWIADFRDPWTGVYYLKDMKLSNSSFQKHLKLEKEVLLNCDVITTVGNHLAKNLLALVKEKDITDKIVVLPNGFDRELNFEQHNELDKKFSIVYIGLFSKEQNHPDFWRALSSCVDDNADFAKDLELKCVGNIDPSIEEAIIENNLLPYFKKVGFVSHSEAENYQRNAQVLLLSINNYPGAKEMLTGKLFEYIASGRPILCLGPQDGDAAAVINNTSTGEIAEWDDENKIKSILKKYYALYKSNDLNAHPIHLEKYHRKNLTEALTKLL
jgi:glycosyltransferase involved in cell wall biosynthesis